MFHLLKQQGIHVPEGVSFADGELAWTSFDKTLVKAKVKYSGFQGMDNGGKIHPTQKPVALYNWILETYATKGMNVLDTHLGSGSIAIACHYAGVNLVACELDTTYYEKALKRIKEQDNASNPEELILLKAWEVSENISDKKVHKALINFGFLKSLGTPNAKLKSAGPIKRISIPSTEAISSTFSSDESVSI